MSIRYVIFDTPGQIEVFTWSASGAIITETLVSDHHKLHTCTALESIICYLSEVHHFRS